MPGRQAHGRALSSAPQKARKNNKKTAKRSQNAFAIAQQENEEKVKVRRSRLGDLEGPDVRVKKRSREDEDEDAETEDDEEESRSVKKRKSKFDAIDVDEGSDSEGNEWRMGDVEDDDESDLDSDNAFGESDEERFDGYAFSGSQKKPSKKGRPTKALDLDEDEEMDEDGDSDDESLGSDAIDLATMLDQGSDSEEEIEDKKQHSNSNSEDEDEEDEEDDDSSDDESSASSMDDDDSQDPEKLAALQSLIANLPQGSDDNGKQKPSYGGASEYNTPSEFGVTSKTKLTLEDLGLSTVRDPNIKKSLKLFDSDFKKKPATLAVPLAKRQQDRLDRAVAYEKSKETLDKWKDTVAHNRRAEHLVFPLPDADMTSMKNNNQLQSTAQARPFNDLEAAIQSIMEESGLATANGRDDEDKIREFEQLQENKMSVEDVKARRDQLRMARELMFREEAKSKRIKKIKSKSYRKVHRKEREREEQKNQQALLEAGIEPDEDEQEAQDRRRATERMGDKHRGSKWARATKATGRAAWDDDARAGITEMARRDEELRKRVEGRNSRRDEDADSETSYDDSEDESDEEAGTKKLLSKLDKLDAPGSRAGPGAKLANMDFMLRADALRKQQNDDMVKQVRKELTGNHSQAEEEDDSDEDIDVGRRSFGPSAAVQKQASEKTPLREFEEREDTDEDEVVFKLAGEQSNGNHKVLPKPSKTENSIKKPQGILRTQAPITATFEEDDHESGAWSKAISKKKDASSMSDDKRRKQDKKATAADELDISNAAVTATQARPAKKMKAKSAVAFMRGEISDDDSDDGENDTRLPFAIKDQELIKRAFAGADVVGEFEAEKRRAIEEDDEKVVDNTLPGWGSWTGDGLSKKDKKKNSGRFLTKTAGIKEADRKDAKLEKVIVSEKRVKKNSKYLASQLPHEFETRQQYERSLRLPVGPEWSTKETFQNATKPRILLKQGIIAPMSKPLL